MLAGGSIAPTSAGSDLYALILSRSSTHWPFLAWAVTLADVHGFRMRLTAGPSPDADRLVYRTSGYCVFGWAYCRWYPPAKPRLAVTPDDLELTEQIFAVWAAQSLASHRQPESDDPITLHAPRLSRPSADRLACAIAEFGLDPDTRPAKSGQILQIPAKQRTALAAITRRWVPAKVFNPA